MKHMEHIFLSKIWEMGMWFLKYSEAKNPLPIPFIFYKERSNEKQQ